MNVLVVAKSPVAGRVKTRLCPPLTFDEAALVAQAALIDTLIAVSQSRAGRRVIALDGEIGDWLPAGFEVIPQSGASFNERLANAWDEFQGPGVQIGMDTPQITSEILDSALDALASPALDAVLGPALDGGWWAIGFRKFHLGAFEGVPMGTARTGLAQAERLESLQLNVLELPTMQDVDVFDDAVSVAGTQNEESLFRAQMSNYLTESL